MEVAGGVIAVVSLGIQLAESVQKIRNFLRGVKEASEELQRLITKIDLLYDIFENVNGIIEQQRDMPSHHRLIQLFVGALRACETSVNRLESELVRVQDLSDSPKEPWRVSTEGTSKNRVKGFSKKRHALRSVICKETVDDLCSVVDESVRNLNLVLTLSSNQLL